MILYFNPQTFKDISSFFFVSAKPVIFKARLKHTLSYLRIEINNKKHIFKDLDNRKTLFKLVFLHEPLHAIES